MAGLDNPRYPEIQIRTVSANPLVLVAKVRQALRRAAVRQSEIDRFTEQALSDEDPDRRTEICEHWVTIG